MGKIGNCNFSLSEMRVFRSIEQTEKAKWASLPSPGHPYHSWEFLRAVERAKPKTTQYRYMVFPDAWDGYAATAVLSVFETSVFGPRLRIAACGIPFPGGQHSFVVRHMVDAGEVHQSIAAELEKLAKEAKAHLLLVKELGTRELVGTEIYRQRGFVFAPSIPLHRLQIRWPTFEGYLRSMKWRNRGYVTSALKAMGARVPELLPSKVYDPADPMPRWVVGGAEVCSAAEFYRFYFNVAGHGKTKSFQVEPPAFFEELYRIPGITVLAIKLGGRTLAAALLLENGTEISGMFIGKSEQSDKRYSAYLNLINGSIQLAIERGCHSLSLGQTSDETKIRRGAEPERRFFFIRARNPLSNKLLHAFQSKLFPEPALRTVDAFHEKSSEC